jgi:hypothetical protein
VTGIDWPSWSWSEAMRRAERYATAGARYQVMGVRLPDGRWRYMVVPIPAVPTSRDVR